ncbi:MAG: ABC transporter ATP-binding protein [Pseudomonadales bacterium]
MDSCLVELQDLSFTHRQGGHAQKILDTLTLQLSAGEVVVLTGPSGSGKSTLLTIIGGLRRASEGSVNVLGTQVVGAREKILVGLRRRIGFIFQQHNLAPALSVAQNIQMGLQLSRGHRRGDAIDRIRAAAESVGIAEHLHKLPNQLSGGQQQRAGIARALVDGPKLILADEPTASLDRESGQQVMDLFATLATNGSAVVLVTHDKRITDQADRILMMEEGRLVPAADRIMKDASASLRTLQDMDPIRLGKMMSFGHALARVALADGRADVNERGAMAAALRKGKVFSGAEIDLVIDLALSQALAWEQTRATPEGRNELATALEAVAAADDVVTDEERAVIRQLLEAP